VSYQVTSEAVVVSNGSNSQTTYAIYTDESGAEFIYTILVWS
jgi:hypothetical protein